MLGNIIYYVLFNVVWVMVFFWKNEIYIYIFYILLIIFGILSFCLLFFIEDSGFFV